MDVIKWDDNFSVNVKLLDKEHKKLIHMINEYHSFVDEDTESLRKLLKGLIEYTVLHFAKEENFFEEFEYDKAFEHKKAHAILEDKVHEMFYKFSREEIINHQELSQFLGDWLKKHIEILDKEYAKCFNKNGLT